MIDLYKKVKYAGITWRVINQEHKSKYVYTSEIKEGLKDFYEDNLPDLHYSQEQNEEVKDEETYLTLFSENSITNTFFDTKTNEYEKSNIYKILNNIIKPKIIKKTGGKYKDLTVRLLRDEELKILKEANINIKSSKDWWLEDANEWTTNYVACVSKNGDIFYDCVFYYNDVKPVIVIPFTQLSQKQQDFLKSNISINEAPPEEDTEVFTIDPVIEESEVEDLINEENNESESLTEETVVEQTASPVIPTIEKKKKIKYKHKKIKISTADIENLQSYYEILCIDENIPEEIKASLMDTISQLI